MSQMQAPTQRQQSGQVQQGGQQAQGRQFPTKNYLSQQVRSTSITALNQALADVTAVTMQLQAAHWNVRGMHFYQLHEVFEDVYEELLEHVDVIAERATALGGQAMGTAPVVAQRSSVPHFDPTLSDEQALLDQVATSLASLDATLYDEINRVSEQGDLDTADLLNEVSRTVSKSLWLVEAHLQGQQSQQMAQQGGGFQAQQFQVQQ